MRRTKKPKPPPAIPSDPIADDGDEEEGDGGFFACYLLCSLSPSHKGKTYIGFTVNPRRRLTQHNGEKCSGAWRTKHGRPWEMVLCVYGFPTNVAALQFEWAWQHPTESLAVRKAASNFKSLTGLVNKIKLAYTMLSLPSWENLNLTINFFSTKHMKHTAVCPKLPKQMRVNVCPMDDLPCYTEGQIFNEYSYDDYGEDSEEDARNQNITTTEVSDISVDETEETNCELSNEKLAGDLRQDLKSTKDYCSSESPRQEAECSGGMPSSNATSMLDISANEPIRENSYCWQSPSDGLDWAASENFREQMELDYSPPFAESSKEYKKTPSIETPSLAGSERILEKTPRDEAVSQRSNYDSGHHDVFKSWRRTKSVNRKNDCWKTFKPDKQLEESGADLMRQTTVFNSRPCKESDVIDLSTPSSCKIGPHTKHASEIIDLTDSPVIYHL